VRFSDAVTVFQQVREGLLNVVIRNDH
jgi:hypothetical protein